MVRYKANGGRQRCMSLQTFVCMLVSVKMTVVNLLQKNGEFVVGSLVYTKTESTSDHH